MAIGAISNPAIPAISPTASSTDQRQAALAALQEATLHGDTDAAQRAFATVTRLTQTAADPADQPQVSITV